MKAITNARMICGTQIIRDHTLLFTDRIESLVPRASFDDSACEEVIDAAGAYVAPGFINMHIHGCAGCDAMDASPESIAVMSARLPATGVTAFLPTTMTASLPELYRSLSNIRAHMAAADGAEVLGAHLEGPFVSETYKGAQSAEYLCLPDLSLFTDYLSVIKLITLAPELSGAQLLIHACTERGILTSIGHSAADYETALAAIRGGAARVTHCFNALPPLHQRLPGVIGAALDSTADCELICDNIHVHPALQRLLYRVKGAEHIILITDSMRACLMGDGTFDLGGQAVHVRGSEARLADGTLAGSVLTMDRALAHFMENTGADLPAAVRTVTENPARELGLFDSRGSLTPGKLADIVVFDDKLQIAKTFIKGRLYYER